MIRRSKAIYEVGYFLCRCGERVDDSSPTQPPAILAVRNWKHAYAVFFSALSEGRTLSSFCNTVKNVRDMFDAHIETGRVGWRDGSPDENKRRDPQVLTGIAKDVFDWASSLGDEEVWQAVLPYSDLRVADVPPIILADLSAELEPDSAGVNVRTEGGTRVTTSTRAERSPVLRNNAIDIHGCSCAVCGFCFESFYGQWGKGFIEVHHLVPLNEGARETNPEDDLAVLCANCHRMVHRKKGIALTVSELKAKLVSNKRHETAGQPKPGTQST